MINILKRNRVRLLCLSVICLVATSVNAHPGYTEAATNHEVSASQAKRITRAYLSKLGYGRNIGPGGAHIDSVTKGDNVWLVKVFLRTQSATSGVNRTLYVHAIDGRVSERAPVSTQLLVDRTNTVKTTSDR